MAKVHLNGLSKTFPGRSSGDVAAVEDFSIEVADHEFVALVGAPRSGKSTVLRMIAGLEEISRGSVSIGDRRVNDLAPNERDVGMAVGGDALYPHLNVFENMAFGLRRRKFLEPEIQRRVNEAAAMLGLDRSLTHKPGALSREDRQRVAFGRAIVRQPKVLLLDDPLVELDSRTRVEMRAELGRLHHRLETTVIYATSDPAEAMTLADRIVVLDKGVAQQIDTPRGVYNEP